MNSNTKLVCELEYIDISFESFAALVQESLEKIADLNKLSYDELRFRATKAPNFSLIKTMNDVHKFGIPIFDYYLHKHISPDKRKDFLISASTISESFSEYMQSIFCLYFILMTRGRASLNDDEPLPRFLTEYLKVKLTWKEIANNLSSNDLTKMDHKWVKMININNLPLAVRQRLLCGIAGTRLFNIFKVYKPQNIFNLSPNISYAYEIVKRVAMEGPYLEMHPLFMPARLASISISRNLKNLILDVYTKDEVTAMVKSKSLFEIPIADNRYRHYENWDENTFDDMRTKLVSD